LCPERSFGDGASWRCGQKRAVRKRIAQGGCSLFAERLGHGGVRFDLAEQNDQRVEIGGREGSICFRQERLSHWLALEADVGGMTLEPAEGAGNTFAGFWHGGAFSRLATVSSYSTRAR
jgi:hypothetical protein